MFVPHSTSQPTSPLMHSPSILPHKPHDRQGKAWVGFGHPGAAVLGGSFGPAGTHSPWGSRCSPPPSPNLTAHWNFTCS